MKQIKIRNSGEITIKMKGKATKSVNSLAAQIMSTHQHFFKQADKAINISLTLRNWLMGYYIIEFEQNGNSRANYGDRLIPTLAEKCKSIKGIDERALRNFRQFYQSYPQFYHWVSISMNQVTDKNLNKNNKKENSKNLKLSEKYGPKSNLILNPIRGTLSTELQSTEMLSYSKLLLEKLSYSHFEILSVIEEAEKRNFYENECIDGIWGIRELKRQINSLYYERSNLSKKPKKLKAINKRNTIKLDSSQVVKSVYSFEFLGLKQKDAVEENDLETALLDHLQDFMIEMGNGFCLESRQKKILIGDTNYFIDLVFYHRILKCHILVELKVDQFAPLHIGQLNTYVNYFKKEIKQKGDKAPIGILLVTNKNKPLVEFATAGMDKNLFVSTYLLKLPKKEKLAAFVKQELKNLS